MESKNEKRVFIIEDDANILYGLQARLGLEGFKIEVNNGSGEIFDLVNKIKTFNPKYVILDLLMPEVDGFEIAKAIKSDSETEKIIIFAFTNLSDSDSKNKALDVGVDYYFLKKELTVDELVDKIIKILANRKKQDGKK